MDGFRRFFTSFMAFESASSSEETGTELDDSEAYLFTMLILSTIQVVLQLSFKMSRSFFLIISGGEPKSGPRGSQKKKENHFKGYKAKEQE